MATGLSRVTRSLSPALVLSAAALTLLCGWAYWPTLTVMVRRWATEPEYSHGYLVPVFAAVMLWLRSNRLAAVTWKFSWLGVPLLALGLGLRAAGAILFHDWLDAFSMLVCVAGIFALLGGWAALRWSWAAIAFLTFMIPLPFTLERALAYPLRRIATVASNYTLQTIGLPALAQGNVIVLSDVRLGVAEACSGLSMLVIFIALATAVAILVQRPWWERAVIVASAVPVAILANVTRITVTGMMHQWVGHEFADLVFHDLAGWLMMPFALVVLWTELWMLNRLFVEVQETGPMPLA